MNLRSIAVALILLCAIAQPGITQPQTLSAGQGIDEVEVVRTNATVEKVDLEKRKVTLILENGKKKTFKVDPTVQNLDRVAVGDHLMLGYTDELVVTVDKSNGQGAASVGAVSVAPKGAKPGAVMVETTAVRGKILEVDAGKHKVSFLDAEGKKKTVKVSKNLDVSKLQPGETVNAVLTESLIVEVTK